MNPSPPDHSPAPGQTWTVDSFRPEDAAGVVRLFETVYGPDYPVRTFLDPERLIAENAAGVTISSVARTPLGDIVGHSALFRSAACDTTSESGAGVTHPNYRTGSGRIFPRMVAHGLQMMAPRFEVEMVFGEPVLNHLITQKLSALFHFLPMALEVDLMPAEAYQTEPGGGGGRVGTTLEFKTIVPRPHRIHLPAAYAETLTSLYQGFDDPRDFAAAESLPPVDGITEIEIRHFESAGVARLPVRRIGPDFAEAIARLEADLARRQVVVFQVWLPLAAPAVGFAAEVLRGQGHFLGGLLPRWFGLDGLLMQRLLVRPNWEGMRLFSDRAKYLCEIIRSEWERLV